MHPCPRKLLLLAIFLLLTVSLTLVLVNVSEEPESQTTMSSIGDQIPIFTEDNYTTRKDAVQIPIWVKNLVDFSDPEELAEYTPQEQEPYRQKQKDIERIYDIADRDSIFYRINILDEMRNSISGTPLSPLPEYENPCWKASVDQDQPYTKRSRVSQKFKHQMHRVFQKRNDHQGSWRLRCFPRMLLIGVSKSGTTDLFARLVRHPDIYRAAFKEVRFWNRQRTGRLRINSRPIQPMSFTEYLDCFDAAAEMIHLSTVNTSTHPYHRGITAEGTPHYLWDFEGWEKVPGNEDLQEPRFTIPQSIWNIYPDVRILVILRNPTARLYSQYNMLSAGSPPEVFHDLVLEVLSLWQQCRENRTIRSCAYDAKLSPHEYTTPGGMTLRAGLYSVFLRDWLTHFPRSHFLVVKAEEYYRNIGGSLNSVFSFLGMTELDDQHMSVIVNQKTQNSNIGKHRQRTNTRPMLENTRSLLDEFYRPFIEDLAEILEDDRFLWRDD